MTLIIMIKKTIMMHSTDMLQEYKICRSWLWNTQTVRCILSMNPCYKTTVILRIWFINLTKNYYEHIQLVVIYQTGPLYEHLGWK